MFRSISPNTKFLALTLLALAILVLFLIGEEREITKYPSSGTDVLAIGDSLVAGVGSSSGGFVDLLGVPVINLGVSGDTTRDVLDRIKTLDAYKPKVVILLVGGNDFLRKVPEEEVFKNLEKIIEEVHRRGSSVLLLGVRSGILSNRHDKKFETLADRYGTAYVEDVLDGIFGQSDLMHDTIHPNDKGYALIAERVRPALHNLLK